MSNLDSKRDKQVSSKRRKVLKGAGVATVAGAAWHKPVLNTVILPAHAQTSVAPPIQLNGATGTTAPVTGINNFQESESLVKKVVDKLIPEAKANGFSSCAALVPNGDDDYTHCVSMSLPGGEDPNGAFTLDLQGPDVYYNFRCEYDGTYYYEGVRNFSGNAGGTLANRAVDVTINGFNLVGEVSEDFSKASGTIINTGDYISVGIFNDCGTGYGAYWEVDLNGAGCNPGAGAANPGSISTEYYYSCFYN